MVNPAVAKLTDLDKSPRKVHLLCSLQAIAGIWKTVAEVYQKNTERIPISELRSRCQGLEDLCQVISLGKVVLQCFGSCIEQVVLNVTST